MANWVFNPSDYTTNDYAPIPAGDHRVRINDAVEKTFSSGNEGFEITLDVSGHNGKLWYYLVFDRNDPKKTNQRIGAFLSLSASVILTFRIIVVGLAKSAASA